MTNNDDKFKVVSLEDRIRAKLGVDENYLSDEDINYPDVFSVAELNIGRLFPSYKDFEGDNLVYFESILVLESCILVCPSMPARLPKKELGPHASHELWINWEKKKDEFINERDVLVGRLEGLLSPDIQFETFKSFGVTYPSRGLR